VASGDDDATAVPSKSAFASMFAAATAEACSTSSSFSSESDRAQVAEVRYDENGEECCEEGDEECVDSPFCSITFIDESGDDNEGEGGNFVPPLMDLELLGSGRSGSSPGGGGGGGGGGGAGPRGGGGGGGARTRGGGVAPPPPAACAMRATIEVCTGKACTKGGAQEVLRVVRGNMPTGWSAQPGRKCMAMCKRACVVRVTSDTDQVVHTNVDPATAAITVLPGRSYPAFPAMMSSSSAMPAREVVMPTAAGAGAGAGAGARGGGGAAVAAPAAAVGFFAAAAAAVEKGDFQAVPVESGDEAYEKAKEGKKKKSKSKSNSEVLRAARMASARIDSMDIAGYDTDKIDRR
jgi:hypothetical protein